MKNFFYRTIMVIATILILRPHSHTIISDTSDTINYGISICGIEDEEEPFDQEPTPNNP